jgi:hypothetical protein
MYEVTLQRTLPSTPMPEPGIYVFDAADARLTLMPMAVRRALDVSGVHLSLRGWQTLSLLARRELVQLGAAERVEVPQVLSTLRGCETEQRAVLVLHEPDVALGPCDELLGALQEQALQEQALTSARWQSLRALDRYVLTSLARRGKLERLTEALAEILASS